MDEYKAPIENLQFDYLTQHVVEDDSSDEDEDEEDPNKEIRMEDTDSRDSDVIIGPSPVKNPSSR